MDSWETAIMDSGLPFNHLSTGFLLTLLVKCTCHLGKNIYSLDVSDFGMKVVWWSWSRPDSPRLLYRGYQVSSVNKSHPSELVRYCSSKFLQMPTLPKAYYLRPSFSCSLMTFYPPTLTFAVVIDLYCLFLTALLRTQISSSTVVFVPPVYRSTTMMDISPSWAPATVTLNPPKTPPFSISSERVSSSPLVF